jgi:hypothetical protein
MRLTHFDYIKLVKEAYTKRQANNDQPLLAMSTPSNIRRECLNVYRERYHKKDEPTLRAFFGPAEEGKGFIPLIKRLETDKFRPLDNYLKGNTDNTDPKNLELLAWLIGFEPRPYKFDNNLQLSATDQAIIHQDGKNIHEPEKAEVPNAIQKQEALLEDHFEKPETGQQAMQPIIEKPFSKTTTNSFTSSRALIALLILVVCSGAVYTMMEKASNGCMYWASDHYEKVLCNDATAGRLVLPLNEKKMKELKRITMPDTITERSIGKLFYIKDSNKIEYYTAGGFYPENVNRSLKKLSRNIFEKDSVNRRGGN